MTTGLFNDPSSYSAEFRLSITQALGDQLHAEIAKLAPEPLTETAINALRPEGGVYQLYLNGKLIYVGKADKSLPDRLHQHRRKLSGRVGISIEQMTFTCLYVIEDLSAMAPEDLLIKHYKDASPWNNNGFGNKDPGRNRDRTLVKARHFDALYPIDLDHEVEVPEQHAKIKDYLESLKSVLPYNLRYHESLKAKNGIALTPIVNDLGKAPAREHFKRILASLPAGWQLTALPGYTILYEEQQQYSSALAWLRRVDNKTDAVIETAGPRVFDTKGKVNNGGNGDDADDES
ncbi:Eco29kI family restriction endonuclease [Catenulispora sp. NL8]|uniref:Eco29kI family restriction endonuclease n=1 Tax=Catenulispora pinistramenti TaxID=2705254 RepID=A0ABS5KRZ4_9ACTN|nr:GIY-YIG nuclease family protein [Catenulispora pinistramenti]MBS2548813.1 Eco29kI family restriction endonuclease [Catenulispora pinistramenti]